LPMQPLGELGQNDLDQLMAHGRVSFAPSLRCCCPCLVPKGRDLAFSTRKL
jgi:hypothetical protein